MLIENFLEYLKVEKNYSVNTLLAYKSDLLEFQLFIDNYNYNFKIDKANYKAIRSWIISMANNGLSNRSINRKISSLKSFYRFLVKTETISSVSYTHLTLPTILLV